MRLKDKVAIVTGAGRGLGREYALNFAKEGAKVTAVDINWKNVEKVGEEIKGIGGEVLTLKTDISDEESVEEMAKRTYEKFGKIDVLVNNAAMVEVPFIPSDQLPLDLWEKTLRVNVVGSWLCAKAVFQYMKKQMKGKIINVTSGLVWIGGPGLLPYCCSKGAIIAMTTTLAREWGKYNINVNAISPGLTLTEAILKTSSPEWRESERQSRCIKRDLYPSDIVGTVIFLASDESDMITGQVLVVDGGRILAK